jgi:predicted Zn-dependent protease
MPLDAKAAKKLADQVLGLAKKAAPGAQVAVNIGSGRDANTRFARNEITSTGDVEETTVSVSVALGLRRGSSSTNQVDAESLRQVIDRAARLAKLAPEDPETMPVLGPQTYAAVKGAYDQATATLGAGARAEAAAAAIAAGQAGSEKLEVAGFYEHAARSGTLATSAGLFAHHAATSASFSTTARTADGTGSGWASADAVRASEVDAPGRARVAADKAVRSRAPKKLDPGRYTVVLEPAAVAELAGFLTGAMDARRAEEGRSFFAKGGGGTRVGEKLFPETITVRSDPGDARLPTAPFSGEGLPQVPRVWIDRGAVATLMRSRFWAQKTGQKPVPGPGAWIMEGGGAASTEELVSGVKRGVLITRFWYTRWVDPRTILITGLTRDGVFLIEGGKVVAPVNNFRFNESPVQMLAKCDAMTKETVRVGRWRVPALRTHEFNLASVSEAV